MTVRGWWLATTAALLVQLVVLYAPRAPSAGGAPHIDKVIHAVVFAAVAFTASRAGFDRWTAVTLLVAHAVVSEVVQAWVLPHRSGDWRDVVADCAGVALGAGAATWRRR